MQLKVLIARFPFGAIDHKDTTEWVAHTLIKAKTDPRVEVHMIAIDDYPIPMARNRCLKMAREEGYDAVVMIDNDMSPDLPVAGAKPFWDSTLDFVFENRQPCMVAVPYCGPPPLSNMYVFRWASWQNPGIQDQDFRLEQFSREEAAIMTGIGPVGALPTGLIWIDLRILERMDPPWFYYEYTDRYETDKASTEDVTFTRDAALMGVPIYCNWDAWAGHWKRFRVDKPIPITVEAIRENYRKAMKDNLHAGERMMEVRSNGIEERMAVTTMPRQVFPVART